MTLNSVMALILRYFTEFGIASGAHCVKVIEDVVVKKFTFAISSPGEFLVSILLTTSYHCLIFTALISMFDPAPDCYHFIACLACEV